jgi:hypothetical protein
MKIKMLSTQLGSRDGRNVQSYNAGEIYDTKDGVISEDLVKVYVDNEWAKVIASSISDSIIQEVDVSTTEKVIGTKELEPKQEEKKMETTPENKSLDDKKDKKEDKKSTKKPMSFRRKK